MLVSCLLLWLYVVVVRYVSVSSTWGTVGELLGLLNDASVRKGSSDWGELACPAFPSHKGLLDKLSSGTLCKRKAANCFPSTFATDDCWGFGEVLLLSPDESRFVRKQGGHSQYQFGWNLPACSSLKLTARAKWHSLCFLPSSVSFSFPGSVRKQLRELLIRVPPRGI